MQCIDRIDEVNARQVEIIFGELFEDLRVANGFGLDVFMPFELSCTEEEWQDLNQSG